MPRIFGIDLPDHKKVLYALQAIYGVGKVSAARILVQTQIDPDKRARDLTNQELSKIQKALEAIMIEGDLRRQTRDAVDTLIRTGSYRGDRHRRRLPARGQRTKTNSRVVRGGGPRRTVGSMTKEMAAKLEANKK